MPDSPARPLRIVVLGGGTAGWMAASLMQRRWGERGFEITVLESPDIGIIGVGEGSTPQLKAFFDSLGIAESERFGLGYSAKMLLHGRTNLMMNSHSAIDGSNLISKNEVFSSSTTFTSIVSRKIRHVRDSSILKFSCSEL